MNKIIFLGFLAITSVACSGSGDGGLGQAQGADRLVLDIACSSDAGCPTGFECESEVEHGVTTTFCASHQDGGDGGHDATDDHGDGGHDATDDHGDGGHDSTDDHGDAGHDSTDDHGGTSDDGTTDDDGQGGGHHGEGGAHG